MGEATETDFEQAGLLDGLEGAARDSRLELLRELADDGVGIDELREADRAGRLALLPVERALAGSGPRYSAPEVAELAGVDVDFLLRIRAALGVPEPDLESRSLTDEDVEAAKRVAMFRDAGLPEEGLVQVARTIGIATAQIAQSNRELIVRALVGEGDSEAEVARRLALAASSLMPLVGPILEYGLRLHLTSQIGQDIIEAAGIPAVGAGSEMAVCFADLVDFTKLGERLDLDGLGELADRLGELASGAAGGQVRLVKQIGDAVMLVSHQVRPLVDAALELSEAAAGSEKEFPELRIGMDRGKLVARSGDFYGPAVNKASRITAIARPGSVLVSGEVIDALGEQQDLRYSSAGERSLKGISGRVRLFRIRRNTP